MTDPSPAPEPVEVAAPCLDEYRAAARFWHDTCLELRADLARALPVVEAAGAVVEQWAEIDVHTVRHMDAGFAKLLDALARAYRAAREPRTGEGA